MNSAQRVELAMDNNQPILYVVGMFCESGQAFYHYDEPDCGALICDHSKATLVSEGEALKLMKVYPNAFMLQQRWRWTCPTCSAQYINKHDSLSYDCVYCVGLLKGFSLQPRECNPESFFVPVRVNEWHGKAVPNGI